MLIDGLMLNAGGNFQVKLLDDARRGPAFPASAAAGDLFEITDNGQHAKGIYLFDGSTWTLTAPTASPFVYDISGAAFGVPETNVLLSRHVAARPFVLNGDLVGSIANALTPPSANVRLRIVHKDAQYYNDIGYIVFASGQDTATFEVNFQGELRVARGESIIVYGPDVYDPYFADVAYTLCGYTEI